MNISIKCGQLSLLNLTSCISFTIFFSALYTCPIFASQIILKRYALSPIELARLHNAVTRSPHEASFLATRRIPLDLNALLDHYNIVSPTGSSIRYNAKHSHLIVANTPSQQQKIQKVLSLVRVSRSSKVVQCDVQLIRMSAEQGTLKGVNWNVKKEITEALQRGRTLHHLEFNNQNFNSHYNDRISRVLDDFSTRESSQTISIFDPFERANQIPLTQLSPIITETDTVSQSLDQGEVFSVGGTLRGFLTRAFFLGLHQQKDVDTLAQPSLSIQSGKHGELQIGRQIRFPTSYASPRISQENWISPVRISPNKTWYVLYEEENLDIREVFVNGRMYYDTSVSVTPSHPQHFNSKLLGLDLKLHPLVDSTGEKVELSIRLKHRRLIGFVNYGTPIRTVYNNISFEPSWLRKNFLSSGNEETDNSIRKILRRTGLATISGNDSFPPGPELLNRVLHGAGIRVRQVLQEATTNVILFPVFQTCSLNTTITVRNRSTLILGGLMKSMQIKERSKIPILSSTPLLHLLAKEKSSFTKTEKILVTITPTVRDAKNPHYSRQNYEK